MHQKNRFELLIERALSNLHKRLEAQIGVLNVSTVEVIRPDQF